jgi:Zn finger protein HypA/HybF involved in hydrogenase expression
MEEVSDTLKRCVKDDLIKLCDYGCGQKAKYLLKNGKQCCVKNYQSCPAQRRKNSKGVKLAHKNGKVPNFSKDAYTKGQESFRKNLQEQYDLLPFVEKPLVEKIRIILHEQNYRCIICNIKDWCGKPLTLHLDHINGDNTNDKRENLRYICPNCHSQTKTYCGKNIKKKPVTDSILKNALKNSKNTAQALIKCNLVPKGANYIRAKKLLKELGPVLESGETSQT